MILEILVLELMKSHPMQVIQYLLKLCFAFVPICLITLEIYPYAKHQLLSESIVPFTKKDTFKDFEEDGQKDVGLPANPMQLMDIIRRSTSMNDATSPTDAIDQAIKAFYDQDLELEKNSN